MTGSTNDPDDPTAVAHVCYMAAAVYAAFLVFCGCQVCSPNLSASYSHLKFKVVETKEKLDLREYLKKSMREDPTLDFLKETAGWKELMEK